MEYNFQLQVYEGPLDLLYDLITKHKIEIKDISIVDITNQYIEYLRMMDKMDLEVTSDFIAMASKLLEIKSKFLLYNKKEDEEDPRLDFMEQLEEYKKFKEASQEISKNMRYIKDRYYRNQQELVSDESISFEDITLQDLLSILPNILNSKKEKDSEEIDEKLDKLINERVVPIEEKTTYIREILLKTDEAKFSKIVDGYDINEIVATFLSLLELIKVKEVVVEQDILFNDILIKKKLES
ncbi:segregation/condensation protein A [Clostridioides mangenotii]|uniref:segregation and condensation protein A n=1 Tax=Metaclostridioides mangenotii TaxID=1540 RepID=UPI001C10F022|nr:segregation/condensation protein A [Clostridioides mangenotii]MBU5306538.1 segregation/condensation protein A [Clostridioides mangenotii]